jgi:hypothetical protein
MENERSQIKKNFTDISLKKDIRVRMDYIRNCAWRQYGTYQISIEKRGGKRPRTCAGPIN